MSNLTMLRALGEEKLGTLSEGVVKSALTDYYNKMLSIDSTTWDAYKSFAVAYANMSTVKNDDKSDRFPTKGRFYDFVGVNDSTGSLMLRSVGFNEIFRLDGVSLEDMGFSPSKVDMLSRVGAYKPKDKKNPEPTYDGTLFTRFIDYVATRFADSKGNISMQFSDLASYNDVSLRGLIKDWEEAGKPDKYTVKQEQEQETPKQEQEQEQEQEAPKQEQEAPKQEQEQEQEAPKQEQEQEQEAPKQEIQIVTTREGILASSLAYIGYDKSKVNEFIKWLKAEMLKEFK